MHYRIVLIYNILTRCCGVIFLKNRTHDSVCKTYWDLWKQVQTDPEYAWLRSELEALEPQYEAILSALPEQEQQLLDRYITLRENLNRRTLEFACSKLKPTRRWRTLISKKQG